MTGMKDAKIRNIVLFDALLRNIGEDPLREGLKDTPRRVAEMYDEVFDGYKADAELDVQFSESTDMITLDPIEFYSFCEHHILPFFGDVKIAYIPHGKVVGISKLGRLVDKYAHRLQIQERMTMQIADEFIENVHPLGLLVVVQAQHLCMAMRGIHKHSVMSTSAARGIMIANPYAKQEALSLLFSDKTRIL